ncbi:MAG: CPBP family intramembrane metalloprotease [Acidobacteria bacterium]|nr:CPBP family intramembrane metalloprotease [Acidobacteriota bacterium]
MSFTPNPLNELPGELLPAEPAPPASGNREDPVWSGWDVALLVVAFLVALFVTTWVAAAAARRITGSTAIIANPVIEILVEAASQLVFLVFALSLVRFHYGQQFWGAIKWNFPRSRWAGFLVIGFAMAMALAPFLSGLEKIVPSPRQLPIDQMFSSTAAAYALAIFGTFWAPFIEEMFFRGFLYPALARRLGTVFSVVLTAFAFAALHGAQLAHAFAPLAVIFVVGLVLTTIRARTQSVGSSTLVHMGYNGALFLMSWYGSDHFRHLEKLT